MFTIKFKDSNAVMTAEFNSYLDLVYFVADKKIKDEDFVSINFGAGEINGIDGLCNYTKDVVTEIKAAQEAAEAEYQSEDGEEFFTDEDEEESDFSEVFGEISSLLRI